MNAKLSEEETKRILYDFNNTASEYPKVQTIHRLFEEQAKQWPDRIAVVYEDSQFTYRYLNSKANQLARVLRGNGVRPDSIVALVMDRSVEMIIGIMGILKADGAYLPIDPGFPPERVKYVVEDSQAELMVTREKFNRQVSFAGIIINIDIENNAIYKGKGENLEHFARFDNLVYVIYTSGTTGKPKGTLTTHRNVVRVVRNTNYIQLTENDRILQLSNYAFDGSTFDIYGALLNGAVLVMVKKEEVLSPDILSDVIRREQISVFFVTTALFNMLVDVNIGCFDRIRNVLFGGERVSVEHSRRALEHLGAGRVVHVYGPTETTVYATYYFIDRIDEALATIPIGQPTANTTVYILDGNMAPVSMEISGEIYIGGDGLARGYLNQPELTVEKFVSHPFREGELLYKTGDLGRWLPDGDVEFLDRIDQQVKIRGFRIELEEIEHQLLKHDRVKEAVVLARHAERGREKDEGDKYLCAYVVPVVGKSVEKSSLTVEELRGYLLRTLPDYMIPSYFIQLERMPLTANGKVDRKALPVPEIILSEEFVAPRSRLESQLAGIWSEVLHIDKGLIGVNTGFFELGGHSLRAMLMIAKLHKIFAVRMTLEEIFQFPTIEGLSGHLKRIGVSADEYRSIDPVEEKEYYLLSSAQKRMYILDRMELAGTGYNIPMVWELGGEPDRSRLEGAFRELISRHESFRTSFLVAAEEPVQRIHDNVEFGIEYFTPYAAIPDFVRPFDLSQAPLVRAGLIETHNSKHLLMIDMHHIISDGTSLEIFKKELALFYNQDESAPLKIQYKDYVEWKQKEIRKEEIKDQEAYWLKEFAGEVPVLTLPYDYVRPVIRSSEGRVLFFENGNEETKALKAMARETNTTLFVVLLAVFNVLIARLSGQEDIVVGSPAAGRWHADLEHIVGMFINTLAIRSYPCSGKKFKEFFLEIKQKTLDVFENQEYQFEELVERVMAKVNRDTNRNPLFDAAFALQNFDAQKAEESGLELRPGTFTPATSKFDITLFAREEEDRLSFDLEYCTKLFKEETIGRFVRYFKRIISSIVIDPALKISEIEIISEDEKRELLSVFNDTKIGYPRERAVHELFEEQVEQGADGIGVLYEGNHLTYRQLNEKANQLARFLRKRGVGPDRIAAMVIDRSVEMLSGILGILKAGGAYLPIEPGLPRERMKYMVEDSQAQLLITGGKYSPQFTFAGTVIDIDIDIDINIKNDYLYRGEVENLENHTQADSLAYVIYTSGTTGKPKGTLTTHRNIIRVVRNSNYIDLTGNDRMLQLSNYAFDGSTFDIYGALLNGAVLVMMKKEDILSVDILSGMIKKERISVFFMTTALFNALVDVNIGCFDGIRNVLFGGERVSVEHSRRALEHLGPGRVIHVYGPTETTVYASYFPINRIDEEVGTIPIGKPISNTTIYILDRNMNLVPTGVSGEIYIGGDGLARGYLNHPELTAERFIDSPYSPTHPLTHSTIYRTGDLGRWLPGGDVEFLDRIDQQVKIRGFRIELEEIEYQLLKHDRVKEAVVLVIGAERRGEKDEGDKYLCAYVVPVVGKSVEKSSLMVEELRGYLLPTLPDYMIPSYFIQLERMPLTVNGKVDRKALPVPEITQSEEFVAPRSRMESQLAGIWSEVLHIDKELIGINTSFFELGGHSLRATLMTAKIHKIFAVRMTLGEVFQFPTIEGLSDYIKRASAEKYQAVESVEEKEYYLLSSAQKRLYMLARMELESTRYNMPMVWALVGELDRGRLEGAFRELISRHESFRTSFLVVAEEPVQRIHDNVEFEIEYFTHCAGIPDFVRPFDLSRAPLMRAGLIKTLNGEYLLTVDMHHIMSDGISFEIFKKELAALYGLEELSPLRIQYRDYAEWQEKIEHESRERMNSLENYWIRKFEGEIPVLSLPADYRRPVIQGFAGKTVHFGLGRQETQELKALTGRENVTLFMIILAIYNILLTKISGQEDIVVGTPVAGRWHIELENVMGMFVNTLAMRNFPVAQKTFRELLKDIKAETLDSLENQQYQFEILVDKVVVNRDTGRHPLFDVVFAMQNIDTQETRMPDLVLNPYPFDPGTSKFDMTLFAEEKEQDRLSFSLEYCTGLFKEETIAGFIDYFKRIVHTVTCEPGRPISGIEIISEKEKDRILHQFNATAGKYPGNKTVYELFEEQVERIPDGAAVVCVGQIVGARYAVPLNVIHLTYRELNQRSDQLARLLREKGVQADSIVGIMVDRSLIMIIGILGILKAGGAYLPIDAEYPGERIKYMIEDGNWGVLLTQTQYISQITYSRGEVIDLENDALYRGGIDTGNVGPAAKAGHLAYVIYTSGTTGKPKGVLVEHHNVARLVRNTNYLDFNEAHRMLQTGALEFDASTLEIWGAILNGSILYLINKDIVLDAAKLKEVTQKFLITTMWMTSPLFNQVVEADIEIFGGLKYVLVGGDVLNPGVINRVKNRLPHLKIINGYGPTENTTFSTTFLIDREYGENIPIGVPISNSTAYIVDGHMHLLPPGIPGELLVGGEGVSRGYLNNPEYTVGKFAADPFLPGGRLYKTGDFARWLPDGNIEFLGRFDHQVKVRGFRVELEEIESQLLNYSVIKEAVVLAKEAASRGTHGDSQADKYLCAYIVVEDEPMPMLTLSRLRKYLAVRLPSYMIPTHVILLDRMPLTPNGKIDIKALDSYEKRLSTGVEYAAPGSDLEKVIADIWKEVLHLDKVSIYDNFFDVGGNSMYLFKVSYKMQKALNKDIPPVALFQYPTIRSLSEYLIPGKVEVRHVDKDRDYVEALKEGKTRIKKLMGKENEAPVNVEGRFPRTGLEIAVIGMSGRFPGAKNIGEFWENLKNGVESISFCRVEELKAAGVDETLLRNSNFVKSKGGVLEGIEYFDASFFGYVPIEAEIMDPQIRIFHECAWEALEDAGYNPVSYNRAVGLYAGASSGTQWEKLMVLSGKMDELGELAVLNLTNRDFLTTRVSYKLDLSGPSVMMQTACSTSLVAIDMACRGLLTGQCDMALAGGVEIFDFHKAGYIYQEGMINSADGHCRAFDGRANGTVGGEGIGLVVLKLLEEAEADGDYIHAVIKGFASNNDGNKKVGYAAPSVEGQAAVIRGAHCMAEVESESITCIETHGTGTSLGDPVEIEALKQAFGTRKKTFCPIGSVKTNIGHLGAAAGAAGFIKTVLALKHKQIPANLHFETPNPETDFENSPFYVNVRLTEWKNKRYPLRAGVSSFGIGGTNVHIVLEEAPGDDKGEVPVPSSTREYQVIMLSAGSASALQKASANLTGHLQKNPGLSLADVAYTLQAGRKAFKYRKMLVCANIDEAIAALSSPGSRKIHTFFLRVEERPVIFLFPGVGSQYANMGRELYQEEPVFREEMNRCFEILAPMQGYDIRRIIYPTENVSVADINQVDISQLVIFIFEYAFARLLRKWGIKPAALIGYSFGEYAAACIAGVISLEEALKLVILRGRLIRQTPKGAMLSVPLPVEELRPLLDDGLLLSIAVDNGPSTIISGEAEAIDVFEKQLKEKKYLCMRVNQSRAIHSTLMGPILKAFEEGVRRVTLRKPQIPYISNVTGTWISDEEAVDPAYWVTHLKQTVRFADGIKELTKIPGALFIEVGPGRDLSSLVRRYLDNRLEQKSVNLVRNPNQNVSDVYYLLNKIGYLWLYGVEIDWSGFYSGEKRHRVPLPTYPFEGRRYWKVVEQAGIGRREKPKPGYGPELVHVYPGEDDFESGFDSRPNLLSPYEAPRNQMEQDIIHIWQKLLGFKNLGVKDDFFELGGDSIKAISAISGIHKKLNIAISLKEFFDKPNVEALAEYIRDHITETGYSPIKPVEKREYYPLSNAQKRVYILQQLDIENTAYNISDVIPLGQDIDVEKLEAAFRRLIRGHESLRTSFHMIREVPVQRINDSGRMEFKIEYYDFDLPLHSFYSLVTPLPPGFIRPFDLAKAPLLRVGLTKTKKGEYALMLDIHHIISDAVSGDILERELMASYWHPHEESEPHPIQYKDFSEWKNSEEQRELMQQQKLYWLEEFFSDMPVLELPIDYPRPLMQSFEGSSVNFVLDENKVRLLKEVTKETNTTLFMVILSIYTILLSKLSGQEDILVGIPTTGRGHIDLEHIIGMFVNTLVMRNYPVGEKTFKEFLLEVKDCTLEAFENQEYQFEDLVEDVSVRRNTGRNPIFDVAFNLLNQSDYTFDTLEIGEGDSYEHIKGPSRFDLSLVAVEIKEKFLFNLEYCIRLFKEKTIERFIGYFKRIVSEIFKDRDKRISEIEIITEEERNRLLVEFNDTGREYPGDKTLHELFEREAAKNPDGMAVTGMGHGVGAQHAVPFPTDHVSITYKELNKKSNQLAHLLRRKGVQPDKNPIAALMVERTIEMIVGILAVLKAGGAYLPIDVEYPGDRITYMMADCDSYLLLTQKKYIDHVEYPVEVIDLESERVYKGDVKNLEPAAGSDNLAYVIYTSGTTGKPKGVMVEQRNVVRLVKNSNYLDFDDEHRILQTGALAFDASTFEIWGTLLNGSTLFLVDRDTILIPERLKAAIQQFTISTMWVTSPLFNQLELADIEIFAGLKYLLVGGDVLNPDHINRVSEKFPHLHVINGYGPTENTTFSTTFLIDRKDRDNIPIGSPISNSTAYIVDSGMQLLPIGISGELVVGGDGVSRGYLNRPELTAEKFFNYRSYRSYSLYFSERIYKTGDLARWLPNGDIEFIGRIDQQVKIRGFRVEMEEIESQLLAYDSIKEAVVVSREDERGDKYLCAYIVGAGLEAGKPELKEYLAKKMPDYMIPSHFVWLDRIPLTANGKVDRKSLPAPGITIGENYTAPANKIQEALVKVWSDVLGITKEVIGIDSNFFDLGGHSLKATIMVSKLHRELDIKVSLSDVFKWPTIGGLSRYIKEAEQSEYSSIELSEKKEYYTLSPAQKRMYIIQQLDLESISYNLPQVLLLEGKLDIKKLQESFQKLVDRHESFRTSFIAVNGEPVQEINDKVKFEIEYFGVKPRVESADIIDSMVRLFDLSRVPLLRVGLIRIEDEKYILMVDIHHIIMDGVSYGIFAKELMALYNGKKLPVLRLQYKDYSEWKRWVQENEKESIEKQEAFWLSEFEREIPVLRLPTDYARPEKFRFEGSQAGFEIGREETKALRELIEQEDVTLFMMLLAVYYVLLAKTTGQDDIVVGIPIAGRNHADLQQIVGMLVNTLPLRSYPKEQKTFREFLKDLKKRALNAFDNQDYQVEDLVDKLAIKREANRNPLFNVIFGLQNLGDQSQGLLEINIPGLRLRPYYGENRSSKVDLILYVVERGERIDCIFEYCTQLFEKETIDMIQEYYMNLLGSVLENIDRRIKDLNYKTGIEKELAEIGDIEIDF